MTTNREVNKKEAQNYDELRHKKLKQNFVN